MNRKELRESLGLHLDEYLSAKGFKIDAEVSLVKKTKTHNYKVFLVLNTYMTVMVRDVFPEVKFNYIEIPLNKIYAFDRPDSEKKFLLNSVCTVNGGSLAITPELNIYDEDDVIQLANIIKEYMEKTAFPFFEKYSNLETINQEILAKDMPYKEGIGYTNGMNDFDDVPILRGDLRGVMRRMFIMTYCKDSRYNDFVDCYENYLEGLKETNNPETLILKFKKIFNDTKEYLANLKID
ncbi:MAG: hypothetical protein U5N85_00340 [Arcicella sp.]|nr:hypothetical protein [Arcicella sp.]